ncbi:MAG: hypothetical protein AABM67_19045, partial [Acidobacteriota bacterium]
MSSEERKFEQVLDSLAEKEKRAQKRATLLTILTLTVGLVLMAGLFYQIVRLRNTRNGLEGEVRDLETKKAAASEELNKVKSELELANLRVDDAGKKFEEIEKKLRANRTREALQIASKGIKAESISQRAGAPGFVDYLIYRGPDKAVISVEVIPDIALLESPKRPKSLYTYALDNKNYFSAAPGNRITFSLDRTVGDTRKLVLFLDFVSGESGGFTIKQTASAGSNRRKDFHVSPPSSGAG